MFVTFDVGGTNTRIGVSLDGYTIADKTHFLTDPDNYEKNLEKFVDTILTLAGDTPVTSAIGGIPGPLIENGQGVGSAPNLPGWQGKLFAKDVSEKIGAPVYLANDTAVIGVGEAVEGAGKGHNIVAYVTVSTGVGGCRIVNHEIDSSARGFEPGHQIIDPSGPMCACGAQGHLEALIGGASLEKQYGKPPKDIDDETVWDGAAKHLAMGLNNMLVMWSPDVFVIGGSVMKRISIEKTQSYLRESVTIFENLPNIVPAALENEAGLIGGLAILRAKGL